MDTVPHTGGRGLYLQAVLDAADGSELLTALQPRVHEDGYTERPQFSARSLLRAYLVKSLFHIHHNADLVKRLSADAGLREACGFRHRVPSARTFNRFIARLDGHWHLLTRCLARVTALLVEHLRGPDPRLEYPQIRKTAPPTVQREREPERRPYMTTLSLPHSTTAPWPGQDDGDTGRRTRGLAMAAQVKIQRVPSGYKVRSQSGQGSYVVNVDGDQPFCTCADFELTQQPCKHIYCVWFTIQREEGVSVPDTLLPEQPLREPPASGLEQPLIEPPAAKPDRDWPAYNKSQIYEQEHFETLLRQLCETVEQPPQITGRPRLPLSDMLIAAGLRVYGTLSIRRSMSNVRSAHAGGLIEKLPSLTSVFRFLEDPTLTPVLEQLIAKSAWPLATVEVDFAPDSTGFSTKVYRRWFDEKWGHEVREPYWVKAHCMFGVKTGIVTAVAVTDRVGNDSPHLIPFLEETAKRFTIREVSADKAYLSRKNIRAIKRHGSDAYIPFKTNSVPFTPNHGKDQVWVEAFYRYQLHRREFLEHYHKRSNAESAFWSIKSKFGGYVRSKTRTAQVNEILVKILAHNICCLIRSAYELQVPLSLDPEVSNWSC